MVQGKLEILKMSEVTMRQSIRSLEVNMQNIWNANRFYEY